MNLYYYYPPNGKITSSNGVSTVNGQPYVYFKPVASTTGQQPQYTTTPIQPGKSAFASGYSTLPYVDSTSTTNPKAFVNPQSYQLLCPGLDGKYGNYSTSGIANCPLYPLGTNYDTVNGIDDMTNFTTGATVGNDTQ